MKRAAVVAALLAVAASAFGSQASARHAALATAHPLATKAGLAVLQRGGTAADAAVAVAFALGVVRPNSGAIGGGGFAVYYDAATRAVWTLDFRETAPLAITRETKLTGASAAGTPGTIAGLDALHQKFGARPWKELLAPAIALARDAKLTDTDLQRAIDDAKSTRNLDIGKDLGRRELAATLQRLADHGARDAYFGELAKRFIDFVRDNGGILGDRDLREYEAIWRAPLKLHYGAYDLYTVAPPSGGGILIGEVLNILAADDLRAAGFQTPKAIHLFTEACRRASIDRNKYIGDPTGARIPYRDLLSRHRAEQWRATINASRVIATAQLTEPSAIVAEEGAHTTHFTIADAKGNVVALTMSLGDDFGSGFLVPGLGFFLNDAMTDFTTATGTANAIAPGKRAASSLTPMIVLRDSLPFLAIGSSGGPAIPTTVLQVFLNMVTYGKTISAAIDAPRYHQSAAPESMLYEKGRAPKNVIDALNAIGHAVDARDAVGDVQAVLFDNDRLVAVSDPRHGGAAGGF